MPVSLVEYWVSTEKEIQILCRKKIIFLYTSLGPCCLRKSTFWRQLENTTKTIFSSDISDLVSCGFVLMFSYSDFYNELFLKSTKKIGATDLPKSEIIHKIQIDTSTNGFRLNDPTIYRSFHQSKQSFLLSGFVPNWFFKQFLFTRLSVN